MSARRRKFYGWGYADEGATPEEIRLLEKSLAARFGIKSFDVTPAPRAEEITLRAPRMDVPAALKDIVSTAHLDRLEHCYGQMFVDVARMFARSCPNPPDAIAFPRNEQEVTDALAWCDEIGAATVLERLDALHSEYGEDRYRASPLLRKAAEAGSRVSA